MKHDLPWSLGLHTLSLVKCFGHKENLFSLCSTLDWGLSDILPKGLLYFLSLFVSRTNWSYKPLYKWWLFIWTSEEEPCMTIIWHNSVSWLKTNSVAMQDGPCSNDRQVLWEKKLEWTFLLRYFCGTRSWGGVSVWAKSSRNEHDGTPWYRSLLVQNGLCGLQSKNSWKHHAVSWSKPEWDAPVPHSDSEMESQRQRWLYVCTDINSGTKIPAWWLVFIVSMGSICPRRQHSSLKLWAVFQETQPENWLPMGS